MTSETLCCVYCDFCYTRSTVSAVYDIIILGPQEAIVRETSVLKVITQRCCGICNELHYKCTAEPSVVTRRIIHRLQYSTKVDISAWRLHMTDELQCDLIIAKYIILAYTFSIFTYFSRQRLGYNLNLNQLIAVRRERMLSGDAIDRTAVLAVVA